MPDLRHVSPQRSLGPPGAPAIRRTPEPAILDTIVICGLIHDFQAGHAVWDRARAALDQYRSLGLPSEPDGAGGRLYDPIEVANLMRWAGARGLDPFWAQDCVTTGRRLVADSFPDAPPGLTALAPRQFTVRLERHFAVKPSPRNLRLRLPMPLEDAALADLSVQNIAPAAAPGRRFATSPGRLEAILPDGDDTPAIAADFSFVAYPTVPEPGDHVLSPDDAALYTRGNEGLIQLTPRLRALAGTLAGGDADPRALLAAAWEHIHATLLCGVLPYHAIPKDAPLDWVLDHGWFDCQVGAALLVALCRARGIPGRICSGYTLSAAAPFYHYWAEIWLPPRGWVPFDLMSWDLSAGGRDRPWRDLFFGALDHRMKTQTLPRLFSGLSPARLPPAWHILPHLAADNGVDHAVVDRATGETIYRDRLRILSRR